MGPGRGAALVFAALCLVASCSSDSAPNGGAGTGGSEAGAPSFGDGACYTCLSQACAPEQTACASDPGCAGYLSCTHACPADPSGYAAADCESACPIGDTSAAQAAHAALISCRESGAGQSCTTCGFAPDGGTNTDPPPILTQKCAASSQVDACDRCLAEKCCDSMDAVSKPGPAADLASCWFGCQDNQCRADCAAKLPDGIPGFGGWSACLTVNCIGPGTCPSKLGPCSSCTYQKCGNELATCLVDTECYLTRECSANCTGPDCVNTCRDAHPGGLKVFDDLALCLQVKCTTEC